jgi:hypothetical protein
LFDSDVLYFFWLDVNDLPIDPVDLLSRQVQFAGQQPGA